MANKFDDPMKKKDDVVQMLVRIAKPVKAALQAEADRAKVPLSRYVQHVFATHLNKIKR